MKVLEALKKRFTDAILDDDKRYKTQYLCTYFILGTVSLFMTIVNILDETAPKNLMFATLIFAVLSYLNVAFVYINEITYKSSKWLFTIEIIVLFSFFLINGAPEGFSAIWALLLPSLGLLLFGKKFGTFVTVILFLIIVLLLRTDVGTWLHVYEGYTKSFKLRFPFVYIAFYFVGLLIETVRATTFENYKNLYTHDNLTETFNRTGFFDYVKTFNENKEQKAIGFIMLDLDNFKNINDTYGHLAGDVVLKKTAKTVKDFINAPLCRWGGEEFVAIFNENELTEEKANELREIISKNLIDYTGLKLRITISIGAVIVKSNRLTNVYEIANLADECLYKAKNSGKNKVIFTDYTKEDI